MATRARASVLLLLALFLPALAAAQAPVEYRLSFKEAEHRLMDVEVTFRDVPSGAFELRMSRSSPGRYSLHEFAKNVFDVDVTNGAGAPLASPALRVVPLRRSGAMHPNLSNRAASEPRR